MRPLRGVVLRSEGEEDTFFKIYIYFFVISRFRFDFVGRKLRRDRRRIPADFARAFLAGVLRVGAYRFLTLDIETVNTGREGGWGSLPA